MPTSLPSGAAIRLLVVLCVTAGCAAAQQQQQPSAVFTIDTTAEELWCFMEEAVWARLQPLVSDLESQMDQLGSRLESRFDRLDRKQLLIDERVHALSSRLNSRVNGLSSRLELKIESLENGIESRVDELVSGLDTQKSDLDKVVNKLDSQKVQLESVTSRLGRQESQLASLATQLDGQQSQLAVVTETSRSEQSRLDRTVNKTASQQTQIDELAGRLDQVEGEGGLEDSEPLPRDCTDLSAGAQSGIYLLKLGLDRSIPPVEAYCDMNTDGGNWTVFQRRANIEPHQDFYLGWAAYKEGFGELSGEFWWGLDKLWRKTAAPNRRYELRVDLESFAGERTHAIYQNFRISSEDDGFRLSADNYNGDAGDGLRRSVNHQFSTRDRDQDGSSRYHCAQLRTGAWWYGAGCGASSLNGLYRDGTGNDRRGIWWWTWKGHQSLEKTTMKIRRVV